MDSAKWGFQTRLIHAGEPDPKIEGAVVLPIFQSSTYLFGGESRYEDLRYIRLNNSPNHRALHDKLANLEGGEAALAASSGMAAISTALLSLVGSGDHILAQSGLYGGAHDLLTRDFPELGIETDFFDAAEPKDLERLVRPRTRAVYVESISNPLMRVPDFEAIVEFTRRRGLAAVIDNTFPSPFNFRPLEWGFDLSLHSATKYLNGHSDVVAGAAIGSRERIESINRKLIHFGGCLDPHACFLLQRGLKTLALRVQHQNASAQRIAETLSAHSAVQAVHYPGLDSHPERDRAARFFRGCGGMLSFELKKGAEAADRFMERLELAATAPSLGGVETLVTRPAATSHSGMNASERERFGIGDGLIRMSIGIEDADDLLLDLQRALKES